MPELNRIVQSLQQEMQEYLSRSGVYENVASTSDGSERAKIKAFNDRVHDNLLALLLALSHNTKKEGERKCEDIEAQAGIEGHGVLVELRREGQVIDQDHEEHRESLSSKATKRGKKRAATAKTSCTRKKISLGMESARDLSPCSELDGCKSKQGGDIEAQEVGNGSLTSEETRFMEQQHEGSVDRLSLKPPARGNDEAAKGEAVEQKKRSKRAEKWTDKETAILLEEYLKKKKNVGRFVKEPLWTLLSKELQRQGYERTGDQCRERMDTLRKSFTTISKYCDKHTKEFSQLQEVDYQNMKPSKPATRLMEGWYIRIRNECPPKSKTKKSMAKQEAERSPGFSKDNDVTSGSPSAGMTGTSPCTSILREGQPGALVAGEGKERKKEKRVNYTSAKSNKEANSFEGYEEFEGEFE